jgi:hypothetical protein
MKYLKILTVTALFLSAGISGLHGQDAIIAGDSMYWKLTDDGVLTITGKGETPRFNNTATSNPWSEYRSEIKELVFGEGITGINDYTARGADYPNLAKITMSNWVDHIGTTALGGPGLSSITLSKNLQTLGNSAIIAGCLLSEIRIPKSVTFIGVSAFRAFVYLYDNNCGFENVYVEWTAPPPTSLTQYGEDDIFYGAAPKQILYVPPGSEDAYGKHLFWGSTQFEIRTDTIAK